MKEQILKRKSLLINAGYVAVLLVLSCLVIFSAGLIMPFWIGLIIATVLQPIIRLLDRKLKLKKVILSKAVLLLFYLIIGGILLLAVSALAYFLEEAFLYLPDYFETTIKPALDNLGEKAAAILPMNIRPDFEGINIAEALQNLLTTVSQKGVSLIRSFFSGIASSFLTVIITILLSYFINSQYDAVIAFLKCQIPQKAREYLSEIKILLKSSVFRYIKSCLIMMVITFAELLLGFLTIGVENPIGTAIGIALLDALPIFGVGTVMIPWVLFELMNGNWAYAGGLFLLYILIDIVRNLLEPKILGKQLGINPIVALVAIYLGYKLLGVAGAIAFPLIAYILLELRNAGKIKLYNTPSKMALDEASQNVI